ncbi:MAG TPA: M3 family metallopeptidase [Nevskiaceae bacterium]|nr:M3 family metallopeptidase [Nevskiaceae bacterium]
MNPLLDPRPLNALPDFNRLAPEHALPALQTVLAEARAALQERLGNPQPPRWETLVEPLDALSERIAQVWGPVSHLFSVNSTPGWREAYNAGLPLLTEYSLELAQSEPLYRAWKALPEPAEPVRRKIRDDALRDFELSGIALPEAQKARYKTIALRLSELQTRFEEHLLDAIQAYGLLIEDEQRLAGMTPAALAQARQKAEARGESGYRLTLDFPSYDAVISYADDRELRRRLYEAYATRASDQGPQAGRFDNGPLIEEILRLRQEQAALLGFSDYAAYSLATKMADSADQVERFLLDLARRARPRAEAELAELSAFALEQGGPPQLEPWDLAYYAEKFKAARLGLSDEETRPYFPLPQVLEGLFDLLGQLYGLRVVEQPDAPRWHPDVRHYRLLDRQGEVLGGFWLDPYARDDKRGGAWMDECHNRRRHGGRLQWPVAYLVCNFRPPVHPGEPALLTHDEVVTLFHEFGHGLHLVLTEVDEPSVAGIHGVEWDAVELPSQFMENWCYEPATLRALGRHWKSGEPLPDALIDKLRASRVFHSGLATLRQVEFALFDLRLHRDHGHAGGALDWLGLLRAVRAEVSLLSPPAFNRMPCSFSHIFAGGYAAGYYSYKWAEVLSADAFAAFEEAGLSARPLAEVGARFRASVLARGGSAKAAELFRAFRGRDPAIEALLRHSGLERVSP